MSYHNTTDSSGAELSGYESAAENQDDTVLKYMGEVIVATPSTVWSAVLPDVPLTSVRRALSNLTKRGKLKKTRIQMTGLYGRPEYVWRITEITPTQGALFS